MSIDTPSRRPASAERGLLLWLGLLYLLFVIYGSLVPLEYQAIPLELAIERFQQIPFLDLGIGSRADWVANLLLFIPLAFFWTGALTHGRGDLAAMLLTAFVWLAGTALALGIEFTQLYFPQRTVSQNDLFAETLGGIIGGLCWWGFGQHVLNWHAGWRRDSHTGTLPERLAWAGFVLLVGYNVLPLDLTLSAVEIYHKWTEGKVHLIPFASLPGDPVQAVFELAMDVVIWVPLAWAWHAHPGRTTAQVLRMTLLAVLALEFMQLFVYSRVSDVTDLLTGGFGAWLGTLLGQRRFGRTQTRASGGGPLRFFAALAWLPVLTLVFWYPFDFNADPGFVQDRAQFLQKVPFETYYYGTEFRAITEVFHKTLFFAPLGALLAWWVGGLSRYWRKAAAAASMLLILAAALGIELGQMLLPGKFPDTTDVLLEALGAFMGYGLFRRLAPGTRPAARARHAAPEQEDRVRVVAEDQAPPPRSASRPGRWQVRLALGVAVLAIAIAAIGQLPGIPYNVRELLNQNGPLLSALLLAVFCFWFAGVPVWLADQLINRREFRPWYAAATAGHALLAALLLLGAAPRESLDDIVGSPILGGPWPLESLFRLSALFVGLSVLLSGGAWLARAVAMRRWDGALVLGVSALLLLALTHYVVVVQAATDNLIELMAGGGGVLASIVLMLWGLLLTSLAAFLGHTLAVSSRSRLSAVLLLLLMLPLSYGLMLLGLEGQVEKYGQYFSALQFLLSPDREHLASDGEVMVRYGLVYVALMAGLVWVQGPFIRLAGGRTRPAVTRRSRR